MSEIEQEAMDELLETANAKMAKLDARVKELERLLDVALEEGNAVCRPYDRLTRTRMNETRMPDVDELANGIVSLVFGETYDGLYCYPWWRRSYDWIPDEGKDEVRADIVKQVGDYLFLFEYLRGQEEKP